MLPGMFRDPQSLTLVPAAAAPAHGLLLLRRAR
jgi:hypothetical protein